MQSQKVYIGIAIALGILWLWRRLRTRSVSARDVFVIDGDTIGLQRKYLRPERVRISNIDAGEIRGVRSLWQGHRGQKAKNALKDLVFQAETIEIVASGRKDRFGRTVGRVRAVTDSGSIDVGEYLLDCGLARRRI